MSSKKRTKASPISHKVKKELSLVYDDESVKDFEYSDYARVSTSARGALLSFGKSHPDSDAITIRREILLPLDVAFALGEILSAQRKKLEESGEVVIERKEKE